MDAVLVSMLVQLVGAAAVLAGGTWAMGPWFLLVAGVVFLVVPELLERSTRASDEAGTPPRAVPDYPEIPVRAGWRDVWRRSS